MSARKRVNGGGYPDPGHRFPHRWCPICRTKTGRHWSKAPRFCKLCEGRGVIDNDDTMRFCAECRTSTGAPKTNVATSECEKCDGRGMTGGGPA